MECTDHSAFSQVSLTSTSVIFVVESKLFSFRGRHLDQCREDHNPLISCLLRWARKIKGFVFVFGSSGFIPLRHHLPSGPMTSRVRRCVSPSGTVVMTDTERPTIPHGAPPDRNQKNLYPPSPISCWTCRRSVENWGSTSS